jgi:hypothetical protein
VVVRPDLDGTRLKRRVVAGKRLKHLISNTVTSRKSGFAEYVPVPR